MRIEGIEIRDHGTSNLLKFRKLYGFMLCLSLFFLGAGVVGAISFGEEFLVPAGMLLVIFALVTPLFIALLWNINAELKKRQISEGDRAILRWFSKKMWLVVGAFVLVILIFGLLYPHLVSKSQTDGYWGADGYYHPSDKEMDDVWDDVNKWMDKNW